MHTTPETLLVSKYASRGERRAALSPVQGPDLSGLRVAGHRMVAAGVGAAVIASAGVEAATIFQ